MIDHTELLAALQLHERTIPIWRAVWLELVDWVCGDDEEREI